MTHIIKYDSFRITCFALLSRENKYARAARYHTFWAAAGCAPLRVPSGRGPALARRHPTLLEVFSSVVKKTGAVRECRNMVAIILQKGIYFFSLSATPFFFRRRACRKFACAVLFREE